MGGARSAEEIRASIEAHRADLALSVGNLRGELVRVTDWRAQFRKHKREVLIGTAVAGFVLGGGIAALTGLVGRRR